MKTCFSSQILVSYLDNELQMYIYVYLVPSHIHKGAPLWLYRRFTG